MKPNNARGLGKGLSALLSEEYSDTSAYTGTSTPQPAPVLMTGTAELPVGSIVTGRFQPRTRFTEIQLNELAASIAKNGVMQPILVRPHPELDGKYEIIAGERRWRATQAAGLSTIPAVIRSLEDQQAMEMALVENVQRQDLTPVEEALGYQRLLDEFAYTQEALSATVGKSRSHIANLLRLLALPAEVKAMLEEGALTMGHARAVLTAPNPVELAQEIIRRGLNVRQAEALARGGQAAAPRKSRTEKTDAANENADAPKAATPAPVAAAPAEVPYAYQPPKDPDITALEETLSENLGIAVSINDQGQKGQIILAYQSLEQLDDILRRLGGM